MSHTARLRRYMAEHQLNQSQLATKVAADRHQVSRWLSGVRPSESNLKRIAKRTGIPLVELI